MTAGLSRQAEVGVVARKEPGNDERLAAALRENLKRRKAQARDLRGGGEDAKSLDGKTSS